MIKLKSLLTERKAKPTHKIIKSVADIIDSSPEDVAEFANKHARYTNGDATKFAKQMKVALIALGRNVYKTFHKAITDGDKFFIKKTIEYTT
jgi:hypothetical protein